MLRMLERDRQNSRVMPHHALDKGFSPFTIIMRQARLPELIQNVFHHYYEQLIHGATGYIYNDEANPIETLPESAALNGEYLSIGHAALERAVILKLNGGLGTSMGM